MKPDQERVRSLLTDTVTLLCKNGLHFMKQLKVEGLIGVTLDDDEVFIVHLNEIVEDFAPSPQAIEQDNEKRLQSSHSSYPRSQKTNAFHISSGDIVDEGRAESSFQRNSLSGKLDISHSESEIKFSLDSNHSHEFMTASVPVKSEASEDLLLIENDYLDMQASMTDSAKEVCSNSKSNSAFDQTYDRLRSLKRIRRNEPGDEGCLAVPNDESDDDAETEILEPATHSGALTASNFSAIGDFVPTLCSVTTNKNIWTPDRLCSNLNPSEGRSFGSEGIPNMSLSTVQSRDRNGFLPTGALCRFGPRTHLTYKPTVPLPVTQVSRRTRFSAEKTYVCQYALCGKTFYQKYNLYRHQREKHGTLFP